MTDHGNIVDPIAALEVQVAALERMQAPAGMEIASQTFRCKP